MLDVANGTGRLEVLTENAMKMANAHGRPAHRVCETQECDSRSQLEQTSVSWNSAEDFPFC